MFDYEHELHQTDATLFNRDHCTLLQGTQNTSTKEMEVYL